MNSRREHEGVTQCSKHMSYHGSQNKNINMEKAPNLLLYLYLFFKSTIISSLPYKDPFLLLYWPYTTVSIPCSHCYYVIMSTRQKAVEQSTRPPLPWYSDPADPGEKRRADGVFDKYLTGKKLFPRELLENIKTILDNHKKGNLGNSAPIQVAQEDYVDGSNRPITLNLGPHGNT